MGYPFITGILAVLCLAVPTIALACPDFSELAPSTIKPIASIQDEIAALILERSRLTGPNDAGLRNLLQNNIDVKIAELERITKRKSNLELRALIDARQSNDKKQKQAQTATEEATRAKEQKGQLGWNFKFVPLGDPLLKRDSLIMASADESTRAFVDEKGDVYVYFWAYGDTDPGRYVASLRTREIHPIEKGHKFVLSRRPGGGLFVISYDEYWRDMPRLSVKDLTGQNLWRPRSLHNILPKFADRDSSILLDPEPFVDANGELRLLTTLMNPPAQRTYIVNPKTGDAKELLHLRSQDYRWLHVSPDGRNVAVYRIENPTNTMGGYRFVVDDALQPGTTSSVVVDASTSRGKDMIPVRAPPDRSFLAVAASRQPIKVAVFDMSSLGKPPLEMEAKMSSVSGIVAAKDGSMIGLSWSNHGNATKLLVEELGAGKPVREIELGKGVVGSTQVVMDGKRSWFAAMLKDEKGSRVEIVDIETTERFSVELPDPTLVLRQIVVRGDGTWLGVFHRDNKNIVVAQLFGNPSSK